MHGIQRTKIYLRTFTSSAKATTKATVHKATSIKKKIAAYDSSQAKNGAGETSLASSLSLIQPA